MFRDYLEVEHLLDDVRVVHVDADDADDVVGEAGDPEGEVVDVLALLEGDLAELLQKLPCRGFADAIDANAHALQFFTASKAERAVRLRESEECISGETECRMAAMASLSSRWLARFQLPPCSLSSAAREHGVLD